jgi:hypothetical protein
MRRVGSMNRGQSARIPSESQAWSEAVTGVSRTTWKLVLDIVAARGQLAYRLVRMVAAIDFRSAS